MRALVVIGALCLTACGAKPASETAEIPARPLRVVSLDFCADQYALKLLDREQILALSPDATKSFSYMNQAAKGLPTVRPSAEDVLILQPDLVLRSYGGGPNAAAFFERAGVPVINIGWTGDIDGIKTLTQEVADQLGQSARGQAVVDDMTDRLAQLNTSDLINSGESKTALYMTPTGVTTGAGSLVHEMLLAAGYENFQSTPGWRSLPLERLAYERPDLIAAAYFESHENNKDAWSAMGHPIAKAQLKTRPTVPLDGAWTSCSAWYLVDAIEALAAYRAEPQNGL